MYYLVQCEPLCVGKCIKCAVLPIINVIGGWHLQHEILGLNVFFPVNYRCRVMHSSISIMRDAWPQKGHNPVRDFDVGMVSMEERSPGLDWSD